MLFRQLKDIFIYMFLTISLLKIREVSENELILWFFHDYIENNLMIRLASNVLLLHCNQIIGSNVLHTSPKFKSIEKQNTIHDDAL